MGLFTRLGDQELVDVAGVFSLGEVRAFEPIAAGTINSNFAVETDRGRWFVRVNEGKAEADVAWEARLVEALAAAGVATPPPVSARDGRPYAPLAGSHGKWVSVFPWRSGRHLTPIDVTEDHAAELGGALASLHLAGAELPRSWRRGSIYDHDHLVARYHRFAASVDPELERAIALLGEELAFLDEAAPVRRAASSGLIHGDLFRDNVLWKGPGSPASSSVQPSASRGDRGGGSGPGPGGPAGEEDLPRVVAILDFEQASGGSLAYDLAVCINDWCWTGEPRLELVSALLTGYQRKRRLPGSDREALLIEVRAAAARFTITRITDVYLARVDQPEKDFRAFLARCEAWRGPALGQLTALL